MVNLQIDKKISARGENDISNLVPFAKVSLPGGLKNPKSAPSSSTALDDGTRISTIDLVPGHQIPAAGIIPGLKLNRNENEENLLKESGERNPNPVKENSWAQRVGIPKLSPEKRKTPMLDFEYSIKKCNQPEYASWKEEITKEFDAAWHQNVN